MARAGAGGGDLNFWRPYVDEFDSPQAYAWVVEALLEKHDLSAAMALLVHWLGQAEAVRLEEGPHSFHVLAVRWMQAALADCRAGGKPCAAKSPALPADAESQRRMVRRFFDLLEANADNQWEVPEWESAVAPRHAGDESRVALDAPADDDDDDDENLYHAAYDEMVYRDSTADGVEGSLLESGGDSSDHELEAQSNRLSRRLAFLTTLARLWKQVALAELALGIGQPSLTDAMSDWRRQTEENGPQLGRLAAAIAGQSIPRPTATHESLLDFDRQMNIKESLSERIIATWLSMEDAKQFLTAAISAGQPAAATSQPAATTSQPAATTSQPAAATSQPALPPSQPAAAASKPRACPAPVRRIPSRRSGRRCCWPTRRRPAGCGPRFWRPSVSNRCCTCG